MLAVGAHAIEVRDGHGEAVHALDAASGVEDDVAVGQVASLVVSESLVTGELAHAAGGDVCLVEVVVVAVEAFLVGEEDPRGTKVSEEIFGDSLGYFGVPPVIGSITGKLSEGIAAISSDSLGSLCHPGVGVPHDSLRRVDEHGHLAIAAAMVEKAQGRTRPPEAGAVAGPAEGLGVGVVLPAHGRAAEEDKRLEVQQRVGGHKGFVAEGGEKIGQLLGRRAAERREPGQEGVAVGVSLTEALGQVADGGGEGVEVALLDSRG